MPVDGFPPPPSLEREIDEACSALRLGDRSGELDAEPEFPRIEFRALGSARLLGLRIPERLGGRGLTMREAGLALRRMAYHSGTTFAKLCLQPEFCSVLAAHGSKDQLDRYFRPLLQGELLIGNQITEPGAGADARALGATAVRTDGGYRLSGTKSEAAFAVDADLALVYARVPEDLGKGGGITVFLVRQDLPGIERRTVSDLGERWMRRGSVIYRDVDLPAEARVGAEGAAFTYLQEELTRDRALLASIYLGVGRSSWEEAVRYVGERRAFGKPLASQQAVAFPLVEDSARLDAADLFVERTLDGIDRSKPSDAPAALAKWLATETALTAIDHAIQFHGGRGYSKALPHEQRWRDVRSGGIGHGPSEIMKSIAARALWPREGASTERSVASVRER